MPSSIEINPSSNPSSGVKIYSTPSYVPGVGPKPAAIAIVGEAPGAEEDSAKKPFVGTAGRFLDQMLAKVGINRASCYITNVIKKRPYANDFGIYYEDNFRYRPIPQLLQAWEDLHKELEEVKPNVIIALGAEALKALLRDPRAKIGNLRGSILQSTSGKVVPTYHPAAILRQYSWYPIALLDLKRAREESASPLLNLPKRKLITAPKFTEVMDFLDYIENLPNPHVAFDIETIKRSVTGPDDPTLRLDPRLRAPRIASFPGTTPHIDCIAIAPDADLSMSIPVAHYPSGEPYWSLDQEIRIWLRLYEFFANPEINFVAQNAQYDTQVMRRFGFTIRNLWLDTMLAAHTVYPEFPKSLDFLTSIYTREPYYKSDIHTNRWEYNAKDAAVTIEIAHKLLADMREFGVEKFYFEHVNTKINILNDIQEQGVAVDMELREAASKQIKAEIAELKAKIREIVGFDLNPNSPKQMKEYLYETLKLPKQYNRKTGSLTANETAIKKLYAKTGRKELELLLQLREKTKLKSAFIDLKFDIDGRIRCQYKLSGTETGRLASSATIDEVGMNMQQIPDGPARKMFVPDKGCVFIEADSSQAEARVVAWKANEIRMIENFLHGDDIHKRNAALIFGVPYEKVTDDQRNLAKRVVHATNYSMGPRKFAEIIGATESRARELLELYFTNFPRIQIWHRKVAEQLKKYPVLETPWGRKRAFYGREDNERLRSAIAFVPQSTVGDLMHRALQGVYARLPQGASVKIQIHDALLLQCLPEDVEYCRKILHEEMEQPIMIDGRELRIPAMSKVGNNWSEVS